MERRRSEQLDAVLLRFMREAGLETPLRHYRLVQAWPDVVGPEVAAQSAALRVKDQALVVRTTSPALRVNLSMNRRQLVCQLNAAVGAPVITDIQFF